MIKTILTTLAISGLLLSACQPSAEQVMETKDYYFSLKDYFTQEASRLQKANTSIYKEVTRNSETEAKEIVIANWELEFGLFIDSDINKLSWKESYEIVEKQDSTFYIQKDSTLETEKILIVRKDSLVTEVLVENSIQNPLYKSKEKLHYYTDSLYRIEKTQKVRVLGENRYTIIGQF